MAGATTAEPLIAPPASNPTPEQEVALVEPQVNVEDCPELKPARPCGPAGTAGQCCVAAGFMLSTIGSRDRYSRMTTHTKKTITVTLPQEELAELDRLREQQQISRSEALREAIRWYIGAMRRLPPAEDPLPDEVEAIRRGEEEFARGECRRLEDIQHELGLPTK